MEVGEGLRNPSLSHSAGADGLTTHQAVPQPPWPGVRARPPAVLGPLLHQEARLKTHPAAHSKAKRWGLLSGSVQWESLLRVTS